MATRQEQARTREGAVPEKAHRREPGRHVWPGVALLLVACSSSDPSAPSACADISGNYEATFTRVSGSCDPKVDGDGRGTISFARSADGTWSMVYPGIDGACPGTLDASCRFTATCKATGKDGAVVATASVDYRFTATGFTGSNAAGLQPPIVPTGCTATYQQTANKL